MQPGGWYQWSLHVLEARLALRRGQYAPAVALALDGCPGADEAPPAYALQADLIAVEALLASGLTETRAGAARCDWRPDSTGDHERRLG